MQLLLAGIVVLPLLGAVAALFPARPAPGHDPDRGSGREPRPDSGRTVLRLGAVLTAVVLAAAITLAAGFDHDHPARMQATTDISWIPALDIRIHLGIDGISLPLLVLTALLTFLCALYSCFHMPKGPSPRAFVALLLVLESGTLATFAVLDLVLFFLAFEMVLIPMYFLIARWGGAQRERAAWKFILYTLLGSVVMLLGLLLIGLKSGTFDMVALATDNGPKSQLSHTIQLLAVLAVGIGLAVKAPMWPLHSWLPDAHTAAPTVGSVLLAGVLLKMGTYGFVRIALPLAPDGMHTFAPYLAAFAAVGIVYGSLACLALARRGAKGDLKRLIAYSSVGHMGFVLLGIATMTPTGVNGALFANIAHGLITGLLFFLVGALKDRYGTSDLDQLAGGTAGTGAALYGRAPRLGGLLAFGAVASLGLPGLAGFWGEMLTMFGAFRPAAGLSRPAFLTFMALAGLGTLLTAAYLLVVVRRVCMGSTPPQEPAGAEEPAAAPQGPASPPKEPAAAPRHPAAASALTIPDIAPYEYAAWSPLAALTVLAGLWPAALLGLTDPAVQQLLGGGK
ncbi:NADH-quinone oxidoreductase subunit M [Streptomyces sp. MST-110588]|uniref:complex I subunit 4 family protein n=1 Tax=Streptomyces sp. MST-110588 TaxID=2833628 RepID=UPI001F5D8F0C|nr:NADH-quinone oxidoreductase subunit M [Streptomyces sp. MST-110588]UNO44039.1 NADH-quinone oxidoreductase subunit M [Streptomyces sp. MST-110588]